MRLRVLVRFTAVAAAMVATLTSSAALAAPEVLALLRVHDGSGPPGQYGFSCSVVGDMLGGLVCQYAIGDPEDETAGSGAGRVSIYSYSDDPPLFTVYGEPGDHLGYALSSADVDGDGAMDLISGAPGSPDIDPSATGRVVIVFGGNPIGARPTLSISGTTPGGRFGAAVAGLYPHVMRYGTGPTPFAVGAPDANSAAGEVHWFLGGDPPMTTPWRVAHGDTPGARFGAALANAGIVSQDRQSNFDFGDLLVGAPERDEARGRASLFFSDAPLDTVPEFVWSGSEPGDHLGASVAGGGAVIPFSPSTRDYVLIGAPGADVDGRADAGRAYLFSTPLGSMPDTILSGDEPGAQLGAAVSIVTYMFDPLGFLVAAPGALAQRGQVRFHAFSPYPFLPDTVHLGEVAGDRFGQAISNSGAILGSLCDHCDGSKLGMLIGSAVHSGQGRAYVYGARDTTQRAGGAPGASPVPRLLQAWPNPSSSTFHLQFSLERRSSVFLDIVDLAGRRVARLAQGMLDAGPHRALWSPGAGGMGADGTRVPCGVYWAVLTLDGARNSRRLIVSR